MDFEIGEKGVNLTFQGAFPRECPCVKCKKPSRLAFVLAEGREKDYIANLYGNLSDGKFWLHDAAAFATYLCTDVNCATATTLWNQA